jgi:hypothetical protein
MPPFQKKEAHNSDVAVEQYDPIADPKDYDGDIILADKDLIAKDYADELSFMNEPIEIRLQPSTDRNAAMSFPVWVNGKPAEVMTNGRWRELGWLPVATNLTVRRSVLEIILRAKVDTVNTQIFGADTERPENKTPRFTTPVHSVSVLSDPNPKGPAWMTEVIRRTY